MIAQGMELRDLEYFEIIARTQNLGQAAILIGRTRPALTKCIRRMEEKIGTALFVRSGRGIILTAVGRMLLERASQLRSHADEVLREIKDFAEGTAGHVRIGMGATPAQQILPNIIKDLITSMPMVTIEILVAINNVLRGALRSGSLDLIVGPVMPESEIEFVIHSLLGDEVVVAACRDHPLLKGAVAIEDLAQHWWVLPAQPAAQRKWLEDTFSTHHLPPPKVKIETNSLYLLPDVIGRTQLLTFMPRRHLWPQQNDSPLQAVELAETTMHRRFAVMYRKHAYLPPVALRIANLLREGARQGVYQEADARRADPSGGEKKPARIRERKNHESAF